MSDNLIIPSLSAEILKINVLKKCPKCQRELELGNFRNCKKNRDGLFSSCRPCQDLAEKIRYLEKKETRKAQIRDWQKKNPEKNKEYQKNWAAKKTNDTSELSSSSN
jgi:hypothetical protein